ncbi:MAG TPA: hypothetical protein VF636_07835 [Sphingomonas sp.]|jgi:hypothetical protein
MRTFEPSPLPRVSRRTWGLMAAAIVAWTCLTASDLAPWIADDWWSGKQVGRALLAKAASLLWLYALFGLVPALMITAAVGGLAWTWADRRGLKRKRDAIRVGLCAGAALGAVSLWMTWSQTGDDTASILQNGVYVVFADEALSPGEWGRELAELAWTTITGGLAGLTAWRVAGEQA